MSGPASVFATHARDSSFTFKCNIDCRVGAYSLNEGESLWAVCQPNGLYAIYVEWGDSAIASLRAQDVNKLIGSVLLGEEPNCTGTDPVRCDDPNCPVHGKSAEFKKELAKVLNIGAVKGGG